MMEKCEGGSVGDKWTQSEECGKKCKRKVMLKESYITFCKHLSVFTHVYDQQLMHAITAKLNKPKYEISKAAFDLFKNYFKIQSESDIEGVEKVAEIEMPEEDAMKKYK